MPASTENSKSPKTTLPGYIYRVFEFEVGSNYLDPTIIIIFLIKYKDGGWPMALAFSNCFCDTFPICDVLLHKCLPLHDR